MDITVVAQPDLVQITLATWEQKGPRDGFGVLAVTATSSHPTAVLTLFESPAVDGTCPLDAPSIGGICNWGLGTPDKQVPGTYNWRKLKGAPEPDSLIVRSYEGGAATVPCGRPDAKGRLPCP